MSKIIVVGGGPSGIMAALTAAKNNHEVILIERNKELGKKLQLTGGGRCNITNHRDIEDFFDKVINNKKFLYSSFYSFTNLDLLKYLDVNNLEYKTEDFNDHKVYIKSNKSEDLIDVLRQDLKTNKVHILYDTLVTDIIIKEDKIIGVEINNNEKVYSDKVIISTGGKSYPHIGSDGMMYDILQKYNHTVKPIYPALSPLLIKEEWIKKLQGISIQNAEISCKIKKKKISKVGDILFAHFGLTGPCSLIFSSYINKIIATEELELNIDLLPNVDKETLVQKIRENPNKNIINNLKGILPQNILKVIFEIINLSDKKSNELSKAEELKIVEYIKEIKLTCVGTKGLKSAMVTSGGINVKEVNASTMESKIIQNLFLTGEMLDIDAETGGYNLQIAFSTGYLAGISV